MYNILSFTSFSVSDKRFKNIILSCFVTVSFWLGLQLQGFFLKSDLFCGVFSCLLMSTRILLLLQLTFHWVGGIL